MDALWSAKDPKAWKDALEAVKERVAEYSKEGYPELDEWFFEELPERLAKSTESKKLEGSDLVKVVEWKLKRGTWRPKLLDYAKNLADEEVQAATKHAYTAAQDVADKDDAGYRESCTTAMAILTKLKGIGPATASAVLTAGNSSFPYMADEAMDVAIDKQREYTVKRYVEFAAVMRQKAQELSIEGQQWTPKDVERALHSEALHVMPAKKKQRRE